MRKNTGKIIKISVEVGEKKFSLNCHEHLFGKFRVKRGRSWSSKAGFLTLTEIFNMSRKWVVAELKKCEKVG